MACIEINYGDPETDLIISDSKKDHEKRPEPVDIRDIPQPRTQIVEITEQEEEETPPPMPTNEQIKQWRREIDERIKRNN